MGGCGVTQCRYKDDKSIRKGKEKRCGNKIKTEILLPLICITKSSSSLLFEAAKRKLKREICFRFMHF